MEIAATPAANQAVAPKIDCMVRCRRQSFWQTPGGVITGRDSGELFIARSFRQSGVTWLVGRWDVGEHDKKTGKSESPFWDGLKPIC